MVETKSQFDFLNTCSILWTTLGSPLGIAHAEQILVRARAIYAFSGRFGHRSRCSARETLSENDVEQVKTEVKNTPAINPRSNRVAKAMV
jgi:hypothetical protein